MAGNSYELTGRVKAIFDQQTFASGFTKRDFVVTTEDDYPQDVKFECIKDRISLVDDLQEGDRVNVHFNIRGNEYNDRYFVNLQGWRIQKLDAQAESAESAPPEQEVDLAEVDDEVIDESTPF